MVWTSTADRMYRVYRNASDILGSTLDTVWTSTADRMHRVFVASDIRRLGSVPIGGYSLRSQQLLEFVVITIVLINKIITINTTTIKNYY